jgi:ABC-type nitrate/sulfonate/bicarbonate transport system substrate-binding protein
MKKLPLSFVIFMTLQIHNFSSAAEVQVVTVALVSPSWNTNLPTAVARGAGFFKEESLEVRPVILSSSGPIMMALLMSGQTDLVIAGAIAILRGISHGAPVVGVSGYLNRISYALMSAKGLKTVAT